MWDRKSKGLKPIVDHPHNKGQQKDLDCGKPQAAFENASGKKRRNKVVERDQSENVVYYPSAQEKKFEQKFKYHEKQANNNWRMFRQIEKQALKTQEIFQDSQTAHQHFPHKEFEDVHCNSKSARNPLLRPHASMASLNVVKKQVQKEELQKFADELVDEAHTVQRDQLLKIQTLVQKAINAQEAEKIQPIKNGKLNMKEDLVKDHLREEFLKQKRQNHSNYMYYKNITKVMDTEQIAV